MGGNPELQKNFSKKMDKEGIEVHQINIFTDFFLK